VPYGEFGQSAGLIPRRAPPRAPTDEGLRIAAVWLKSLPTATHVRVAWAGDGRRLTLDMPAAH
jgi:hypothetical protein